MRCSHETRKMEDVQEVTFRIANHPTLLSGSLRFDVSSWSVGSIWDKSGPPTFAHECRRRRSAVAAAPPRRTSRSPNELRLASHLEVADSKRLKNRYPHCRSNRLVILRVVATVLAARRASMNLVIARTRRRRVIYGSDGSSDGLRDDDAVCPAGKRHRHVDRAARRPALLTIGVRGGESARRTCQS